MKPPVLEIENGNKFWRLPNGHYHRADGPAIEHTGGSKWWYQNNRLHRLDGPAIEYDDGRKHWHYRGQQIDCSSQEEFQRIVKLKAFW